MVNLQCFERTNLPGSVTKLIENSSSFIRDSTHILNTAISSLPVLQPPTLVKFIMRAHEFGRMGASSYGPYSVGYCGNGCE